MGTRTAAPEAAVTIITMRTAVLQAIHFTRWEVTMPPAPIGSIKDVTSILVEMAIEGILVPTVAIIILSVVVNATELRR